MEKAKKKDLDEIMEEALANAPSIEGYSIRQLSEVIDSPWSTTRWHLERLEARGIVEPYELGRAKIYKLKKSRWRKE
jgi:DNA-binding transcriptional ArsR family regulator